MTDDRGVSEVIGFVLVFSLITMTIAIVFTAGLGGLQDARQAEQVNNVERAFDVFHHNIEDLYHRGAPSRATEIRLKEDQLGFGDPVTITLTQGENNTSVHPTPLVYESEETKIVYEGGATIREEGGSSVMLNDPAFNVNENHTSLLIVRTQASGTQSSVSGDRIVLVRGEYTQNFDDSRIKNPQATTYYADSEDPIKIKIETPRTDAWEQYFKHLDVGVTNATDQEVTLELNNEIDKVSIVRLRIDVHLST